MYLVEVEVQGQEQKGFLMSFTYLVTKSHSVISLYFDLGISRNTLQQVNPTVIPKEHM